MNTLGDRLKILRSKKQITQKELAHVLGVPRDTVANWEVNRGTPNIDTIAELANYFRVSADYLLGRTNDLHPKVKPDDIISETLKDEPELLAFWQEQLKRDDLQLLFKQTAPLSPDAIKRIIKYIKMVEDEEAAEGY